MDKVLQICSYYQDGGLYEYLFDTMKEKGADLDVFYFCSTGFKNIPYQRDLIVRACFHPLDRPFYFLKHRKVYRSLLEAVDFDEYFMTHSHSLMSNGYMSYRLKKEKGIPYIVAVRNTDIFVFFKYKFYLRPFGAKILDGAEKVIFLSPASRDHILEMFKERLPNLKDKSLVIPNGIDEIYFQNGGPKTLSKPVRLCFIAKSVEDRNKNFRTVYKVLKKLKKKGADVELVAVGQCSKEFMEKYGDEKITFTGPLTKEEIVDTLNQCHIFLMPSKTETFGLVYAEAMSQGLPVLYTAGQGFDGQFEEGEVGYSIPTFDAGAIARAVGRIVDDYEAMSRRAVDRSKVFNWNDIADEYLEIYREMMP